MRDSDEKGAEKRALMHGENEKQASTHEKKAEKTTRAIENGGEKRTSTHENEGPGQFEKDKRRRNRTVSVEQVSRAPKLHHDGPENGHSEGAPHSENHEFTPREHHAGRENREFTPREQREPREFTPREPREQRESRSYGENRGYGDNRGGQSRYQPGGDPRENRASGDSRDYHGTQRGPRENRHEQPQNTERRSYNPNFSADNKFIGGGREQQYRDFNRDNRSDRERDFNRNDFNRADQPRGDYNRSENQGRGDYNRGDYQGRSDQNRDYNRGDFGAGNQGDFNRENRSDFGAGNGGFGAKRPFAKGPVKGPANGNGASKYPSKYPPKGRFGAAGAGPGKPGAGRYAKGPAAMEPGSRPESYPSYEASTTGKNSEMRLNRYIAMAGKCSRRQADEYISGGDVTVNGAVVNVLGSKVLPTDEVRLRGEVISSEKKVYIVMNKPKGFVTSIDDPHAEKTVMDIVRNACRERIYPVGRLDKSSVGVLLLTNDGDLTEKLTHPSHSKKKVYQVTLERPLTNNDLMRARDGIDLDDGVIIPDAVDFVKPDNRKEVGIEIHSGRNRIVRRIFEEMGYGVHKLDRVYFAGLTKKNLKRGQWRFLTDQEVAMLKSGRYE